MYYSRLRGLGDCLTAGSTEPSAYYMSMAKQFSSQPVRRAIEARFEIITPQASVKTDDQLLDEFLNWQDGMSRAFKQLLESGKTTRDKIKETSFFNNFAAARRDRPQATFGKDAVLDRIVAVYLQWSLVQNWKGNLPSADQILKDDCLRMAVMAVAPMSQDRGPGTTPEPDGWPWWAWALIAGGGVLLFGGLAYAGSRRRKSSAPVAPSFGTGPVIDVAPIPVRG